ncbi:Hypothetical protein NTJ_15814 [Nesidiocoris tenuis]|uniref:APCDD1 domain-containing protein n=1 Tax=Nesidiocoris tenuis TaxID=355587 RepID=A0ABN7BF45_9HEMI|nr:Hypothetical protein NTJ_15814 [Nesidiocoris tenuis]
MSDCLSFSLTQLGCHFNQRFQDRCEIRPGPEYIVRKHQYNPDWTYNIFTFYYLDDGCSRLLYGKTSKGTYNRTAVSWAMQSSANSVEYSLMEIVMVVYSHALAQEMLRKANVSCPGVTMGYWTFDTLYVSLKIPERNTTANKDEQERLSKCLAFLQQPEKETLFVRVQQRPQYLYDLWEPRDELLVGEPRSKLTLFFDPLVRPNLVNLTAAVQDFCAICKKVLKSALLEPPHIRHSTALPIHLSGEWVSMRCEIKHMALFVKRRFKVAGQEWRAEYEFYTDALCMKRTLMAVAEGDFLPAADVSDVRVLGAKDYDFRVVGVSLTAYERGVVASLEEDGRCGRNWQVNVSKNLKPTKGCPALGIKIPTTEYELIRIEQDGAGNAVLFLGQSEDRADEAKKRPTYFQPGMIQCSNVETPLTHFLNSYTNGSSAVRCFSIVTVALATAILASCT